LGKGGTYVSTDSSMKTKTKKQPIFMYSQHGGRFGKGNLKGSYIIKPL